MFARIEQHIAQREMDGPGRPERPRMVSIRKNTPLAPELTIDGARHANVQPLHAPRERTAVGCFCDQMQMVALHGEVHQAKAKAILASRERLLHALQQAPDAKRRQARLNPQRDVHWMMVRKCGATQVRDPRPLALGTSPRSRAPPTPSPKCERSLPHPSPRNLI